MPRSPSSRTSSVRSAERHAAMLAVLLHFRIVVRSMRGHYRQVERACGVSGAHVWALAQVAELPGLKVSELARHLALHQSTASNMVDRLEKAGLVLRRRSARDARVVHLHATRRGEGVLAKAPPPARGVLQQALMALPATRLEALRDDLALLIRHMGADPGDADRALLADLVASAEDRQRASASPRR